MKWSIEYIFWELGLAIDWIASNMYWADGQKNRIGVSKTDGRFQKILISSDVKAPQGIAVDIMNR